VFGGFALGAANLLQWHRPLQFPQHAGHAMDNRLDHGREYTVRMIATGPLEHGTGIGDLGGDDHPGQIGRAGRVARSAVLRAAKNDVKALFSAANPRAKVYILLGLNLGYTQADIASLEHSMIDWAQAIVTRNRHKTGQPQQAKLWPLTAKMLKQEMTDPRKSTLVLLGKNGNPLIVETVNDKGNPAQVDAIRMAFNRLKAKLKITGDSRGFAIFRKTSANNIAQANQDAPHLVDLFLGHTQKTMAKHYANQHFDLLYKATDWLAAQYGFDKVDA
jgi:integrase